MRRRHATVVCDEAYKYSLRAENQYCFTLNGSTINTGPENEGPAKIDIMTWRYYSLSLSSKTRPLLFHDMRRQRRAITSFQSNLARDRIAKLSPFAVANTFVHSPSVAGEQCAMQPCVSKLPWAGTCFQTAYPSVQ